MSYNYNSQWIFQIWIFLTEREYFFNKKKNKLSKKKRCLREMLQQNLESKQHGQWVRLNKIFFLKLQFIIISEMNTVARLVKYYGITMVYRWVRSGLDRKVYDW